MDWMSRPSSSKNLGTIPPRPSKILRGFPLLRCSTTPKPRSTCDVLRREFGDAIGILVSIRLALRKIYKVPLLVDNKTAVGVAGSSDSSASPITSYVAGSSASSIATTSPPFTGGTPTAGSNNTPLSGTGSGGSGGGSRRGLGGCGSGGESGSPPSPPPPPPPPPTNPVADEGSSPRVWAYLAYGGGVLVGVANDLSDLVQSWGTAPRVVFVGLMMVAIGLLVAALQTSGKRARACARLGSGICTMLLVVDIFCKTGRYGWIAGVVLGGVIGAITTGACINEDTTVKQAVVQLCRQAAEGASALWGRVVGLWRRLKPGSAAAASLSLPIRQSQNQP